MPMISLYFILFVALLFCVIGLINRFAGRDENKVSLTKGVLLAASFLFVLWADVRFAAVLLMMSVTTWLSARVRRLGVPGIVFAALCLCVFKYAGFFMDSFERLFGRTAAFELFFPIGISFYSFSAIAYLVNVRKGTEKARSFTDVALYLSFFPKLSSGPIQKPKEFFEQTDRPLAVNAANLSAGAQIFLFGLFKKVVLADRLSVYANQVFSAPHMFDGATVLLGVIAYALQIYLDFSGYSDLAIGSARALGIMLPKNFDLPYCSKNPTELWKRWHISLSSWLQEYIYIPLGGNRKGRARTYINLLLTMLIGGLWHGAQAHYIVWGLWHGAGLAIHKIWSAHAKKKSAGRSAAGDMLCIALTFVFTCIGWIFFRAENMADAMLIIKKILLWSPGVRHMHLWTFTAIAAVLIGTAAASIRMKKSGSGRIEAFCPILNLNGFWAQVAFFVFCGLILGLAFTGASPFIYGSF